MIILALDIATNCGYAYGSLDSEIVSGSWNFTPRHNESKGMRLVNFKRELNQLREIGIGLLVFERVSGFHKNSLVVMAEMHGVVKEWAETAGIPYRSYSSNEIKLYATGKGNASKDEMCNAAIYKFGVDCECDDNRADALALFHLAACQYSDGDGAIPAAEPVRKQKPKGVRRKTKTPA